MKRRNFLSVLAGTLLAPFGFAVAKSCECETEELEDFIPPDVVEITFYGLFREEYMKGWNLRYLLNIGILVYVDDQGYCTFDQNHRHIGYVKAFDDNGILVSMSRPIKQLRNTMSKINKCKLDNKPRIIRAAPFTAKLIKVNRTTING